MKRLLPNQSTPISREDFTASAAAPGGVEPSLIRATFPFAGEVEASGSGVCPSAG